MYFSNSILDDEKRLRSWDLHCLLLLLMNVATKWRAIGCALHFPQHNLDVIGQKLVCIVGGPLECLREMLAQWLGRDKPPECDPATTCVLAIVLKCPSVNEGRLANILERTYQPAGTCTCICTYIYIVYLLTTVLLCHVPWLMRQFLFLGCHPGVGELCTSAINGSMCTLDDCP